MQLYYIYNIVIKVQFSAFVNLNYSKLMIISVLRIYHNFITR